MPWLSELASHLAVDLLKGGWVWDNGRGPWREGSRAHVFLPSGPPGGPDPVGAQCPGGPLNKLSSKDLC